MLASHHRIRFAEIAPRARAIKVERLARNGENARISCALTSSFSASTLYRQPVVVQSHPLSRFEARGIFHSDLRVADLHIARDGRAGRIGQANRAVYHQVLVLAWLKDIADQKLAIRNRHTLGA